MGLQSHVSDCSSESIFILGMSMVANCVSYLRSIAFAILRPMGPSPISTDGDDDEGMLGAGLAGLIVLAEQLNLNRIFSHRYTRDEGGSAAGSSDCVVCLSRLREGEQVRRLACRHVFHKECFDGWLDHLNFNCPLCRSPLVSQQLVSLTERRVRHDLFTFFSPR